MLIKCNECGHDNQLGAIFCRECGAKLDVESIRPTISNKAASGNIFGIIRRIVVGIILLGLLYVLGAMFFPESPTNTVLTDDQQTQATEKMNTLLQTIKGSYGEKNYVFTPDEVTYLYNTKMTDETKGDAATYVIDNMYFTIDSRNFIHILMQTKLAGKVPVTFALKGVLFEDSTGFKVLEAKMGHFKVPAFLHSKIITKFTPGIDQDQGIMKKILDGAQAFKVENSDFTVSLKAKK